MIPWSFGTRLPEDLFRWRHVLRAQYLEARSLLSGYLLSSQGDRVTAANSVEGRYPFLDYRVVEFAARIPPWYKIMGLKEKLVLKKAMIKELPPEITGRVKQPYMAPDSNCFFQEDSPAYIDAMLSEPALEKAGVFNPAFVSKLKAKCARLYHAHLSFKDNMSFIGILSTQLLIDQYIDNFKPAGSLRKMDFEVWHDYSDNGP
jgi:asparagine synthase (glutamine-hydrolysing)